MAKRCGINSKTVAKWRKRKSAADLKTGPSAPKSTVLSVEDEAVIAAFGRHTLRPLEDCLYALHPNIPQLTRSSLHRRLQRHGISRLPGTEEDQPQGSKFKRYPLCCLHIDIADVRTKEGGLYLLVAIDRTSKFALVERHENATRRIAGNFLRTIAEAVPYEMPLPYPVAFAPDGGPKAKRPRFSESASPFLATPTRLLREEKRRRGGPNKKNRRAH